MTGIKKNRELKIKNRNLKQTKEKKQKTNHNISQERVH